VEVGRLQPEASWGSGGGRDTRPYLKITEAKNGGLSCKIDVETRPKNIKERWMFRKQKYVHESTHSSEVNDLKLALDILGLCLEY
jgi:hypothetical protein